MTRYCLCCVLLIAGVASHAADDADRAADRRVYVPIEDLDVVFQHDQRGVLLDQAEFEKLSALAEAESAKRPKPPAAAIAWTKAAYEAKAAEDQLLLSIHAELQQFTQGWQQLSIPMSRTAVEQATLDGEPALIGRGENGSLNLFVDGVGKHVLELKLSTELAALGADRVAAFGTLPVPSGSLTISVPAGKRLQAGGLQLPRPTALEEPAEYKLAIGGLDSLHLRITDRAADNRADVLVFATTGYGLHVMPGEVSWHALTTLQVFGKPVDRLVMSIPNFLEIADIDSSGLESWELVDDPDQPDRTRITLSYRQPFDGERKINLRGVMATPAGAPWTVPNLSIASVTSHVGQVVVQYPAGVRLQTIEAEGVRRATIDQQPASDMPIDMGDLAAVEQWRYDFWKPDFTLRFVTQPRQRDVQTAVATVLDVNATGLDLAAAITVKTRFAPLFDLDLQLPAEWTLLSVTRDDQELSWQTVSQEAGKHLWRIPLSPPLVVDAMTTLQLSIRREVEGWPIEGEPVAVELPEMILPQSNLNEGTLVIRGDDEFDLAALDVTGLDAVPLKADYERLRYQTQDTRYSGELKISRKPSRFSVESVSFARLDPETLHAFLQSVVEVQGGGIRTLNIELPEAVGTSLRFISPGGPRIVEQTASDPQNGVRTWKLEFDRRVRGQFLLMVDLEQSRGDAENWTVPAWTFLDADRQNGYIAIEASGEQRLTITALAADESPLTELDPLDLPVTVYTPRERIIAVFRTVQAGASVVLSEQRFDKEAVPTAICPVLSMETVADRSGELQHRAQFALKVVGVQNLMLTLPGESPPWAVLVDGKPVEIRRAANQAFQVPLPGKSSRSDRTLDVYYQTAGVPLDLSHTLKQSPPQLSAVTGRGSDQPVIVLQQVWKLYHPGETLLVDSDGSLEPTTPLDEPSWLGGWQRQLRQPTWDQLGRNLFYALIGIVAAALPILAIRRFGVLRLLLGTAVVIPLMVAAALVYMFSASERSAVYFDAGTPSAYYLDDDVQYPAGSAPKSGPATPPMSGQPGMPGGGFGGGGGFGSELRDAAPNAPAGSDFSDPNLATTVKGEAKTEPEMSREDLAQGEKSLPAKDGESQPPARDPFGAPKADGGIAPQDAAPERAGDQAAIDEAERVAGAAVDLQPGGLLSLSLELNPPPGSRSSTFRYVGQDASSVGAPLSLTFARRQSEMTFRLFIIALFLLAAWLQRKSSLAWKVAVILLGLALPLGLVAVAPEVWQVLLDGVFFGTLAAAAVWLGEGLSGYCERCCQWCCGTKAAGAALIGFAALMGGSVEAQEAVAKPQASIVVVPYEAGTDPSAAQRILLPHDKFLELWRQAHPDQVTPPPIDGGLVEALYAGKLDIPEGKPEDAVVRVTARYAIRNYVDGQLQVALPLGTVALSSAKLDGKLAAVTPKDGGYVAIVPTAGRHVLDVEFAVPARLSGSTGQFTLPLKAVPAGKLTFPLPAKDLLVRINGSSTVYRRVTEGETTSIELPVDQAGDLTVTWQPPQVKAGGNEVVHIESVTAVSIRDAGVTLSLGLKYRVRQGAIQEVRFAFDSSLKLQSVAGPDLGGWEMQETPDGRELKILFRRAVADQTQLGITLFLDQKIGDDPVQLAVPSFTPLDVTNEIGTVAIFAGDQFQLTADEIGGLAQIDTANYQPAVPIANMKTPPRLAYRFAKRPFTATFQIGRQSSQGQLTALHGVSVMRRKIQSTSRFQYQLTGAPRSVLRYSLPKDFLTLEVKATALADWYVDDRGESPLLIVQLGRTMLGTVETVITGSRPRDPNAPTAEILLPQPLDVTRVDSTLAIWTDESYLASIQSSDGWRSVDADIAGPELQHLRPDQPVKFAFQSSAAAVKPVTIQLTRGEPRLRADSLVTTTVTEFTVVQALALQWHIEGSAVDSLSLTTPKSLSGRLDFEGSDIREVVESDAGDDRVRWRIWFRTPVSGKYFATALAALPPATDQVTAPAILLEQPAAAGESEPIENQRQYVLLINGSQSQLSLTNADAVEPVQKDDLPITVRQELIDQGTELVRLKQLGTPPAWSLQKFAQTESIPASVNVADLTTVIARDGTYRTQAIYTIKNRRRQFLALRLPADSLLLSVTLNNQPSRCVTATVAGATAHLIALPKTSEADLSFPVTIVLAGRLPKQLPRDAGWVARDLQVPSPQVISQAEDDAFGIPVARTRWTVYLADDLEAYASRDTKKHNLTVTPEGSGELVYASAAIQEFNDLLDVVENPTNYRQKSLAANNLKRLKSVVDSDQKLWSKANVPQEQAKQLEEQRQKVVERYSKLQREIEESKSGGGSAQTPGESQPARNFQNQTEALNFALQGNSAILADNRLNGIVLNEFTDETFQFQLQEPAVPQSETAEQAPPQQQSDFRTRGAYQQANEANLEALNSKISGKKSQMGRDFSSNLGQLKSHTTTNITREGSGHFEQLNDIEEGVVIPPQDGQPIQFGDEWKDIAERRRHGGEMGMPGPMVDGPGPGVVLGGMGGMGGPAGAGVVDGTSNWAGWTQAGGLSLPIELPTAGRKFVYTKVGGDPLLTLTVWPKATLWFGLGIAWILVSAFAAALLASALRRPNASAAVTKLAAWALLILGLVGWCILPAPISAIGMIALVIGAFGVVWSLTKPAA